MRLRRRGATQSTQRSFSLFTPLIDAADEERLVNVRAFQSEAYRPLYHGPRNPVHFLELPEILFLKMVPTALCRELVQPVDRRELVGKHGDSPGVFHSIGQPAALCSYSKPVLVI